MEIAAIVTKNKNKIVNIAIVILALIISAQISKGFARGREALKARSSAEIKKNEVLQDISGLEKKIAAYKKLLTGKDPNLIMNSIGNIAKETGSNITSIRPEAQQQYPEYAKDSFNLSLAAPDYHALGNFISRLESSEDVYIVDYIDIKQESQAASELNVNLRVSFITPVD